MITAALVVLGVAVVVVVVYALVAMAVLDDADFLGGR